MTFMIVRYINLRKISFLLAPYKLVLPSATFFIFSQVALIHPCGLTSTTEEI